MCFRPFALTGYWIRAAKLTASVWFDQSAMGDLLGEDFSLRRKYTLYRCLGSALGTQGELFSFRERGGGGTF